jgi:exopolysaccharide biosynthesis protein
MVEQARSWIKENQTLVLFLLAQIVALGAAGAAIIAYMVKLETRVHIMETRGAEFTVARMNGFDQRITALEGNIKDNKDRIDRILTELLKQQQRQ